MTKAGDLKLVAGWGFRTGNEEEWTLSTLVNSVRGAWEDLTSVMHPKEWDQWWAILYVFNGIEWEVWHDDYGDGFMAHALGLGWYEGAE